jgi:GNAT superfamily N-acetyltransferase
MIRPTVRAVDKEKEGEVSRAMSVQLTAFSSDPCMRWLWPEPHEYISHFPSLVEGFGGSAFEHDSAHATADFFGGALWLPPGVKPDDEALEELFKRTLAEPVLSEMLSILEQMDQAHPKEPHWHLAFIGADPSHRGKGIGAALLDHALQRIDEEGLHSYLESSNPRNISLYERHGFKVIREIQVGSSPPVTPMLRVPR